MIISSLEIDNVRSYDSCRIEFDSGTTLLIGDIGCGKSTILMAIEFALFGFGGQKSDALLSKGERSGSVKLAFESNGRAYEIYRAIRESGGKIGQDTKSAWISEDGVKDDTLGVGEMKQKVIQILGTDEPAGASAETSIFRYAVYTPQEDMQAVLADPKKRTETIRRAFKIDGFAVARENAKKVVSEIRRTMKEYSIRFEDVPQLEEKLASHQDMAKDLKGNIALLDAGAKAAGVEVRSCEAAYSKAEKERDAKNKASSEADVLESQIEGIRENIGKATREADGYRVAMVPLKEKLDAGAIPKPHSTMTLRQLDVSMERLRPDADELIRVTAKMDSLDAEIKSLQAGIADHVADAGELHVRVDLMQAELEDAKSSRDDLVARGSVLRGKVRMLEENAESLEHDDSCPLCMQGLHGTDGKEAAKTVGKRIMSLKSNLDEISVQAKEANASISKTESVLSDAREQLQAARDAEEAMNTIRSKTADFESLASKARPLQKAKSRLGELEESRRSVAEYEDAIHGLKDAKAALESLELQAEKASESIKSDGQRLHSLEEALSAKRAEIAPFDKLDETMKSIEETLASWRQKESRANVDLATARTNLKNAQDAVAECKDSIEDRKSWKAKHASLGRYREWMEKIFVPSINIMEERSLESIRARFNRLYGEFYSMLLDDPAKESGIDADFTPIITESGHDQSVYNLSGGEKTSIALAYRLTLAKMVREDSGMESGALMLDEPTDGFSKSQLEKVRTVLDEAGATQVILVSHDAELESYADRIYRVSKTSGKSQIES